MERRSGEQALTTMAPPPTRPPTATTPSAPRPPPQCSLATPVGSVSLPNSPCAESSTLQRTLLLQHARTIDHAHLASRLENNSESLLVDCRPFIAYNVNHIRSAFNVNCCDRFNRKRLQQGKAQLADLATTKEGKEALKRRNWTEVVVYDDCSDSLERLPASHTLFLVMNALVENGREPIMLLGGLRDFQVSHRHLCADSLMHNGQMNGQDPLSSNRPTLTVPNASDLPSPSGASKDIENHPPTQVLPHLHLGNMRDAANAASLRRMGIRFVLNVTAKPPPYAPEPDIVYKQLEAADNGIQVRSWRLFIYRQAYLYV